MIDLTLSDDEEDLTPLVLPSTDTGHSTNETVSTNEPIAINFRESFMREVRGSVSGFESHETALVSTSRNSNQTALTPSNATPNEAVSRNTNQNNVTANANIEEFSQEFVEEFTRRESFEIEPLPTATTATTTTTTTVTTTSNITRVEANDSQITLNEMAILSNQVNEPLNSFQENLNEQNQQNQSGLGKRLFDHISQ